MPDTDDEVETYADATLPATNQTINYVNIKLPAFMEAAVIGWFHIAEAQFILRNVTVSSTKFYHVISVLPPDVISRLPADLLSGSDYNTLKAAVIDLFEKSKPEIFDKLISGTAMTGRPSLYLNDLKTLAAKVGVQDDLVLHKFFQALPPTISAVLVPQKNLTAQQVGKLADEMMPYFSNNSSSTVNLVSSSEKNSSHNNNNQSSKSQSNSNPQQNIDKNQIPLGLRPFNDSQKPKICRAHLYFADKAKYCKPWCRYPQKTGVVIQPNSRPASPARNNQPLNP